MLKQRTRNSLFASLREKDKWNVIKPEKTHTLKPAIRWHSILTNQLTVHIYFRCSHYLYCATAVSVFFSFSFIYWPTMDAYFMGTWADHWIFHSSDSGYLSLSLYLYHTHTHYNIHQICHECKLINGLGTVASVCSTDLPNHINGCIRFVQLSWTDTPTEQYTIFVLNSTTPNEVTGLSTNDLKLLCRIQCDKV